MFARDNPGGVWLAGKRKDVEDRAARSRSAVGIDARLLGGAVTAWTREPVMIDTDALDGVEGVMGERRVPGEPRYDLLMETVAAEGWDPGQDGNAVLVGVAHDGRAWMLEGNTRLAVARALGLGELRAEIRWFNGAESEPGPFRLGREGLAFCRPEPPTAEPADPDGEAPSP